MRSTELDLSMYDTDKIANGYLHSYDRMFAPLVDHELLLLEIGINRGGSLQLWRDYFPRAQVTGIDILPLTQLDLGERIQLFQGSQADPDFLDQVAQVHAPNGFDLIIDDGAHVGVLARVAFWHLFEHHLKPGGWYVVEDWGTGYWDNWPDGKAVDQSVVFDPLRSRVVTGDNRVPSHDFGMVGFVKELVDEQGAGDLTLGAHPSVPRRLSKFASLTVLPSLVFVQKALG